MHCHFSDKVVGNNTVKIFFPFCSGQSQHHSVIKTGMRAILTLHVASSQNLQLIGFAPAASKKDLSPPYVAAHHAAAMWCHQHGPLCLVLGFHQAQMATA